MSTDLLPNGNIPSDNGGQAQAVAGAPADLLSGSGRPPPKYEPGDPGVLADDPNDRDLASVLRAEGVEFTSDNLEHPEDEGIVYVANDNHPFSPHSPLFHERTLREDDVVEHPGAIPGVQARATSISLSPEEREAALKQLLETELASKDDEGQLVLEFGPLAALERRMRGIALDTTDKDVAEVVMSKVRRCIHEVVVTNSLLGERESSQAGLAARMEAVKDLQEAVGKTVEPLLERIEGTGLGISRLRTALNNTLEVEMRRLEGLEKNLVPGTIGNRVFEGLVDLKDAVVRGMTFKDAPLVGDLRRHRNEQLTQAMGELNDVAMELRGHAGDKEWESTQGIASAAAARELMGGIRRLTKGVEDQVDFAALNKGLEAAQENLREAAHAAADQEHKARMQRMLEFLRHALDAIAVAVSKVLGFEKKSGDGPAPTKFAPG